MIFLLVLLFSGAQLFAQGGGMGANGELAFRALQTSFPNKFSAIEFIDDDWTITAGEEIFYWANGRILPADEKDNADSYSPHSFYRIPARPVSPDTYTPQYIENMRRRGTREARQQRPDSHRGIQAVLYGALDREGIEALLEDILFLGKTIKVHKDIVAPLRRVEAAIRRSNGGLAFINSLGPIAGYNWRPIAETQRMSYHSWGIAIDIQPRNLGGRAIYWQWERARNDDWMLIPLENRWNPPIQVIEAFEREGFIWGGLWAMYDNMHFEYRPELLEYTRLLAAESSAAEPSSTTDLHHVIPENLRVGNR